MSLQKREKENEKLLEPLHNDFNKTDLCMPVGERVWVWCVTSCHRMRL